MQPEPCPDRPTSARIERRGHSRRIARARSVVQVALRRRVGRVAHPGLDVEARYAGPREQRAERVAEIVEAQLKSARGVARVEYAWLTVSARPTTRLGGAHARHRRYAQRPRDVSEIVVPMPDDPTPARLNPSPPPRAAPKRKLLDWCAWAVNAQQDSAEPVALPA